MKKIILFFIILFSANTIQAQLYIMKTHTGGCSNYSESDPYYGSGMINYVYEIRSKDGNWLCPIIETGEYLIFDQKPVSYYYEVEHFGDYNVPFDRKGTFLIVEISNCQKAVGSNYGDSSDNTPYFEIISNEVLTPPGVDNSFSDKIKLKATGCTGIQKFSWEYKIKGGSFQKTNVITHFDEEFEFTKSNFIPADYYGTIEFRAVIDSDPTIAGENVPSNIVTYNIIPSSPKIATISSPNLTKCNYSNDGEVSLTFNRELLEGEQYELSLKNTDNVPIDNKVITKAMMKGAKTYTWTGLSKQKYIVTYQTKLTIGTNEYHSDPLDVVFTIDSPLPLSFYMTVIQPSCKDDKGDITITATGGTPPYFYKVGNNNEVEFPKKTENNTTIYSNTVPILVEGGTHKIVVRDNNNCIEKIP
jgi:hypothetical protein